MEATIWSRNFCWLYSSMPKVLWNIKLAIWILKKKKMFRHCVFLGFQWCIIAALMILQKLYVCEKYVSWVIDENAFDQICTYKTVGDLSSIFCM